MAKAHDKAEKLEAAIVGVLIESDKPLSGRALAKAIRASGVSITETVFAETLRAMVEAESVTVERGARKARLYWLPGTERPTTEPEALPTLETVKDPKPAHGQAKGLDFGATDERRTESHSHWLLRPPPEASDDSPEPGNPFSVSEAPQYVLPPAPTIDWRSELFQNDAPELQSEAW